MDDSTDNKKHAVNSRPDKPTNVKIEAQRAFSDSVLYAVEFKAVSTSKPSYLAELVSPYTSASELRSSSRRPNQLYVPNVKTVFGSRAFRYAAPAVWNGLPSEITDAALSLETFKSRLKTYLYNQSFRCCICDSTSSLRQHMMRYKLCIIIIIIMQIQGKSGQEQAIKVFCCVSTRRQFE